MTNFQRQTREALFLVFSLGIGVLAGISALAFLALIALGQWAFWPPAENFLIQVSQAPWWLKLLVPAAGGLALGPVIAFWVPELRGPGIPEVVEAATLRDSYIPPRVTVLKTLCTALTLAAGSSVGREGPVATTGAAIGSSLGRLFNLNSYKIRVALACGAAGGIAATFNAPFAGTLFAVEIILGDIHIAYLGHIALASILAVVVVRHLWAGFPMLYAPAFQFQNIVELGFYLLLGLLGGLLALLFIRAVYGADTLFRKLPLPEWLKPCLGGLALGLVGLAIPEVFGVGYDSINLALTGELVLTAAALILAAKLLATAICLGSTSGGVFGPSLFLGSMMGTVFALAINHLIPAVHLHPADYALVGMGTVVSGTTLAPFTAILIIFELTRDYRTILPLIIACVPSMLLVKLLYGHSIYQTKLLRRGIEIARGRELHILRALKVKDCMRPLEETISDDTPWPEILRKAEESTYPAFVVLDGQGRLSGILTIGDVRKDLRYATELTARTKAKALKTTDVVTVTPEDDLETAVNLLEENDFLFLPVVSPEAERQVLGTLKLEDISTVYNQKLLKWRLKQLPPGIPAG